MRWVCLAVIAALNGCGKDETLAGHGGAGRVWHLAELGGKPFAARATLEYPEPGRIAGQAPCNVWQARLQAPYPWFAAEAITATRRGCPDLAAERGFLEALARMREAELLGPVLILRDGAGGEMLFRAGG